jgi:hypothetical protein
MHVTLQLKQMRIAKEKLQKSMLKISNCDLMLRTPKHDYKAEKQEILWFLRKSTETKKSEASMLLHVTSTQLA